MRPGEAPAVVALLTEAFPRERFTAPLFYRFVFRRQPASAAEARRWAGAAWDDPGLATPT